MTGGAGPSKEPSTSSAQPVTEMAKHQVYLKKLNYQEKVSEVVKNALKPVFAAKTINKDQYKDIMRFVVVLFFSLFLVTDSFFALWLMLQQCLILFYAVLFSQESRIEDDQLLRRTKRIEC